MKINSWLPILLLGWTLLSCSTDFTKPTEVVKKYRALTRENKNEEVYDNFISSKSKETINRSDFIKVRKTEWKGEFSTIEIAEIRNDTSKLKRFKTVETWTVDGVSTKTSFYYTLINEQNKWLVIWSGQLLTQADEKYNQGKYEEARNTCKEALALNPFDSRTYRKLANCYFWDKQLSHETRRKEAINCLSLAVNLESDNSENYYASFRFYNDLKGEEKNAISYLQKGLPFVLNDKDESNFYSNISGTFYHLNDFDNANKNIEKAIELDSKDAFNWYLLGKIYHSMNKVEPAKAAYRRAISLSSMDSSKQSDLYANYASCLLATNQCDSATICFNKASDIIPKSESNQGTITYLNNLLPKLYECFLVKQKTFEKRQEEFHQQYASTSNQAKASFIFNEANKWSTDHMSNDDFEFRYWQGQLSSIYTDKGASNTTVVINSRTVTYHTTVSYKSDVYNKLMQVDVGSVILFSGRFNTEDGLLEEGSGTENGRMYNPEFNIRISLIEKKKQDKSTYE
jgi:tetratricopeptide (TPR) repeat protein